MGVNYDGILVIGDPHAGRVGPVSRASGYGVAVLRKLSYAAWLSREWRLLPLITGDLLNRGDGETSVGYLTELMKILKTFYGGCVRTVGGNHDYGQGEVAQGSAYELLLVGDGVRQHSGGYMEDVEVAGKRLRLGYYGHGEDLPREVDAQGVEEVWLLTHHDLAFGDSYPGCMELFEIKGVSRVINGHMHGVKLPQQRGMTQWLNLGNITRRERRDELQCPNVWVWPKKDWEWKEDEGGAKEWVSYEERSVVSWRGVGVWEECELETGWAKEVGTYKGEVGEDAVLTARRWGKQRVLYPLTPVILPHEEGVFRFDRKTLRAAIEVEGRTAFASALLETTQGAEAGDDVEELLKAHLEQVLLQEGETREQVSGAVLGLWRSWSQGLGGGEGSEA